MEQQCNASRAKSMDLVVYHMSVYAVSALLEFLLRSSVLPPWALQQWQHFPVYYSIRSTNFRQVTCVTVHFRVTSPSSLIYQPKKEQPFRLDCSDTRSSAREQHDAMTISSSKPISYTSPFPRQAQSNLTQASSSSVSVSVSEVSSASLPSVSLSSSSLSTSVS